jgi:hypothetical protein
LLLTGRDKQLIVVGADDWQQQHVASGVVHDVRTRTASAILSGSAADCATLTADFSNRRETVASTLYIAFTKKK